MIKSPSKRLNNAGGWVGQWEGSLILKDVLLNPSSHSSPSYSHQLSQANTPDTFGGENLDPESLHCIPKTNAQLGAWNVPIPLAAFVSD